MRFVLFIIITSFHFTSNAQIDLNNPPWNLACDSATTQIEMNICNIKKSNIAESILNLYYDSLIKYIDYKCRNELKESKGTTNAYEKKYIKQLKDQKNIIIKSRVDFKKFLNSTIDIINYQYEGGSIRPMMVSKYSLDIIVNQIKVLIDFLNEITDD